MPEEKNVKSHEIVKLESETVLDCLDFEIMIIDRDFKILFANKAFLRKLQMERDGVIGQFCHKITHHLDSPCKPPNDPCPIEKLISTKRPSIEVHTHLLKNNEKFQVSVIAAPIMEKNKEIGYLHIDIPMKDGKDVTGEMNQALEKTTDILRVISLYQEQMTEIRNKTEQLELTKHDLEKKVNDLEKFNNLIVGREMKMVELKKKITELENDTGKN
jgi:hypothetical protein